MRINKYLKEKGIKRAFQVLWQYKVQTFLDKMMYYFTKKKALQDKIIIESHNDFDCNGGAFYDYLIKNGYNSKYKIVWLLKNKKPKTKLPPNVECVQLFKPSFRRAYHVCTAKFFTFDCNVIKKIRKDQIFVYCSHGAGGLKNVKSKVPIPDNINYILIQSPQYAPIQTKQWGLNVEDKRFVYIGYPSFDILHSGDKSELSKITEKKYNKIILWMPTFRKGVGFNRNDSTKEQPLGIPLFNNLTEYMQINEFLKENDSLLIIKVHPMQDLNGLKINDMTNIKVLTGNRVKELNINNYRLMNCSDALISDYSGAAYEYLQTNKPLAYVLDDMKEYKLGFVVDNIHDLLAGYEIYNLNEFKDFIIDIVNNKDIYKEKREKIRKYVYNFTDNKNCERLAQLLGLTKEKN
ncbi:MAG: CDP-glycerol glycerophosphotransferase family protein [Clostridia bacterium]|nr:CDP-glycerol glycerophosphotransferase family protein [Clostridia bacterium]